MWVKVTNNKMTRIAKITEFYPTYWIAEYFLKENGKDLLQNVKLRSGEWEIAYELPGIEIEGVKVLLERVWNIID